MTSSRNVIVLNTNAYFIHCYSVKPWSLSLYPSLNPFRWTKLRINMVPATVLEPVSECFLASLIIGWAAHYVFRYPNNHRAERRQLPFTLCTCSWFVFGMCLSQVGHDGLLHVSLSRLVYIGLHSADRCSGTNAFNLKTQFVFLFFLEVMFAVYKYISWN